MEYHGYPQERRSTVQLHGGVMMSYSEASHFMSLIYLMYPSDISAAISFSIKCLMVWMSLIRRGVRHFLRILPTSNAHRTCYAAFALTNSRSAKRSRSESIHLKTCLFRKRPNNKHPIQARKPRAPRNKASASTT